MSKYLTRPSLFTILLFLLCPGSALADGFTLTEKAPPRRFFAKVEVTWTDAKHQPVGPTSTAAGVTSVTFNTKDVEVFGNLPKGTIHDWKQYRKLDTGEESTLAGVFAKKGSPFEILSYDEAYSVLGLRAGEDFLFLPDFSADLDNDRFAETHLFSAINLYNLALNFPQFVNNQAFDFGRSYTASEFAQFGFIFSLVDNIQFDPELGYVTSTPYSGTIIADSMHITGAIPEPTTMLLFGTGLAAIAMKIRQKRR